MLLNLLFNAVKFTPQGRIVVTAALQTEFANHLRLHIAVEDTGIGIREVHMHVHAPRVHISAYLHVCTLPPRTLASASARTLRK